ncbi:hypothetical protein [Methylomonas koyamae]|uniref:hypothetical protein n=1 Tax=Methylomonas koyamae TaxID=702114 RepID=UPI0006D1EC1C|nr:hypothetical protein [Methylomonas koyamae]BBL56977.1 hypothetical protein MKFW12EY_05900 [Methylomonas koyamae]
MKTLFYDLDFEAIQNLHAPRLQSKYKTTFRVVAIARVWPVDRLEDNVVNKYVIKNVETGDDISIESGTKLFEKLKDLFEQNNTTGFGRELTIYSTKSAVNFYFLLNLPIELS